MTKGDIEALNVRWLLGAIKNEINYREELSSSKIHDIVNECYKQVSADVSLVGNMFNYIYANGRNILWTNYS